MIVEKHSRTPRKFTPEAQGNEQKRLTVQGKAVPAEARQAVLESAKQLILEGQTLAQIAHKHGIAERTLEYWLASMGDEYKELRELWIDSLLAEAGELLKDTSEAGNAPLRLARARELWKRATWYAERRDRARYGEDRGQVNVAVQPVLHITVSGSGATNAPQQSVIDAVLVDTTAKA